MPLSREAIQEFQKIYEEEYGEILSDEDAAEMSQRLLRLFQILYRPLPSAAHDPLPRMTRPTNIPP